jgi:uncharacterized protein YbjT (DUF2867 family)
MNFAFSANAKAANRVEIYHHAVHILIRFTITAMILAALSPLATGVAETMPGGTFVDDDGSIHQGSIEAIAGAGITQGCNPPLNTHFCPTQPVTRDEMAAFLVRALELPSASNAGFTDTAASTFADEIDRLAFARITLGCNPPANTQFCPNDPVTRAQMAAFLSRALDLPTGPEDGFVDDDESVFEEDIERLHAAGITAGCNPPTNDRFCPNDNVPQAEMATFLARALDLTEVVVPPRPYRIDVVSREDWGAKPASGNFRARDRTGHDPSQR